MEADEPTVARLITQRANTYALLARLYGVEVDKELLDHMRQMEFPEIDDANIKQGYDLLRVYLRQAGESALVDLAVDYARLFVGAGLEARGGAFPYESFYTSPDHLLMQDARDQVLRMYHAEGMDRADEFREPEDHIALELDFMARLCRKAGRALDAGDDAVALACLRTQADFLEHHLLNWVRAFCADIGRLARTEFYRGVALVTLGYLELEREVLADLISEWQPVVMQP